MAGSAINWESLSREDAIGPIVSSGRYRLDSPSTVTGSPTFAMGAAGQIAEIRVFLPNGKSIEAPLAISGTTAVSLVDQVGKPFSQSDLALIEIEVAMPYGQNLLTTDEPNGSPSAPFATPADAYAAYPLGAPYSVEVRVGTPLSSYGLRYVGAYPMVGEAAANWVPQESSLFTTKIGFLGTSITNGSTAGNSLYAFPQQAVYLCGGRVAIQDSIEAGVPGEALDQMLLRAPDLLVRGIGVLVAECSANDAGVTRNRPVSEWAADVVKLAKMCEAAKVKLVMTMPFPQTAASAASVHTNLTRYRVWLAQAAKSLGIEIAHATQLADPATGYLATAMAADAVHLSQTGHQWVAQAVAKSVLAIVGSTMPTSPVIAKAGWLGGVVDPLMTGTTNPSGGFEQPGGTGTAPAYSCIADTSGRLAAGKWWQADITASADTSRTMVMGTSGLTLVPTDAVILHSKIQVEDVSGDWVDKVIAGTAQASLALNEGGTNKATVHFRCPGLQSSPGIYEYDIFWYFAAGNCNSNPSIWLQNKVPNGSHYKFRWGLPQIYNATALGLVGLPKMPTVSAMSAVP